MVDLQRLAIFFAVADTLSFSLAAARLDVSNSHVSKQVRALEEEMRTQLLHRTTRSIGLTEAGQIFYLRCKTILSNIQEAEQEIVRRQDSPQGVLRITVPAHLVNAQLADVMEKFMSQYPDIELDVTMSDVMFDLADESFDIALRVADEIPMNVYARRLCRVERSLVASPAYFLQRRKPREIADLAHLDCLVNVATAPRNVWTFEYEGRKQEITVAPHIRCSHSEWLRQCALRGMGVALLPDLMIAEDLAQQRLICLLPAYRSLPRPWLYGIYLPNRYLSSKVRLFLDAMEEGLKPYY